MFVSGCSLVAVWLQSVAVWLQSKGVVLKLQPIEKSYQVWLKCQ